MEIILTVRFDQGVPDHFNGEFHPSTNRMSLPTIDSEAQMSSKPGVWSLSAHSSATDFKLSLSPDVAEDVYKLIHLYKHGKDRIFELEEQYRLEMAELEYQDSVAAKYEEHHSPVTSRQTQRILVRMSFTFNSGIVELHPASSKEDRRMSSLGSHGRPLRVGGNDVFILPTISVWTDYAGPKSDSAKMIDTEANHGVLVFNAVSTEQRSRADLKGCS